MNKYFRRRLGKGECELEEGREVVFDESGSGHCYFEDHLSSLDEAQLQSQNVSQFNQLRYMEYLQLQEDRREASFIDAMSDGVKVPKIESFSDKYILENMTKMYGEMDTSTNHFKMLFKTYKEGFLESATKTALKKDIIVPRNGIIAPKCLEIIDQQTKDVFTENEIELYGVLDPKKNISKADWFDLPRPTEKWANHFKDKLKFDIALKRPLTKEIVNLAIYDRKYDEFPKHVVKYLEIGYPDFPLSLPKLCQTFSRVISLFPNGVDEQSFLRAFKEQEHYEIPLNHIEKMKTRSSNELMDYGEGQLAFEDIKPSMRDIFVNLEPRYGSLRKRLLFPSALKESIGSRQEMEIKIVHYIMVSFALYGQSFICLDKIPVLLKVYFHITFNFKDWGYKSLFDFMDKFNVFKMEELKLISFMHKLPNFSKLQNKPISGRTQLQHFLLSKFNMGQEKFKKYREKYEDAESARIREIFEED